MKRAISVLMLIMVLALTGCSVTYQADGFIIDYLTKRAPAFGVSEDNVYLYSSEDLSADILENRAGTLVIERCVSIVDKTGISGTTSDNGYISFEYANIYCKPGDTVVTYFVYNPSTVFIDDIIERYDFVIGG